MFNKGKTEASIGVAHWSKDYVEHLRTIHFSLIAVSVGLIALALARPTGALEKALVQLREIEEVTATSNVKSFQWTKVWEDSQVGRAIQSNHVQLRIARDQFDAAKGNISSIKLVCTAGDDRIALDLIPQWLLLASEEDFSDKAFNESYNKFLGSHFQGHSILSIPDDNLSLSSKMNLADFQDTWNFLASHIDIVVPYHVRNKAYVWNTSQENWIEHACEPRDDPSPTASRSFEWLGLGVESDQNWLKLHQLIGNDTSELGFVSHNRTVFLQVDEFVNIPFDGQGWFMTRFPHWRHGQFKESFPELDEVSADIRSEDLGTIERILRGQQSRSAESFEAFGIKLPAEIVTRFGILLILAVQLYFAIHLSELSTRLKADDAGWEVAWIGVYQHKLARISYFVSVVLLPLGAVAALGVRGLIEFSYNRWSWLTLIIGVICTTGLGILTHLKQPDISERGRVSDKNGDLEAERRITVETSAVSDQRNEPPSNGSRCADPQDHEEPPGE